MSTCSLRLFPSGFVRPLLQLISQSWPIAVTQLNLAFFSYISLPFVGRLGKTEMAAFGLATTTVSVFGTSVLLGLSTACETLLSQAFGEKNYKKVSVFCQQSVWVGFMAVVPIFVIVLNGGRIFQLLGQNHDVIVAAESYIQIYLPVFPISVVYQMLVKFLNCQFIVIPCAIAGLIANAANALLHYLFIVILHYGLRGAALSVILTSLLFTFLLMGYIYYHRLHSDIWDGLSKEAILTCKAYLKLAIPGMVMICLQFLAFEIGMISCALISQEDLSTNTIIIQLVTYCFVMYQGVSIATSIGVGNALGSGSADMAKTVANVSLTISLSLGGALLLIYLAGQKIVPHLFTTIPDILVLAKKVMPLAAAFQLADAVATIANGVIRGCGRQRIGAVINLFGYYIVSLPVGVCLMFPFGAGLGVAGFWSAQLLAQTFLSLLLLIFQFCVINWDQEVDKARKRIHDNHVAKVEAADGRGGGGGGGRSDSGGERSDSGGGRSSSGGDRRSDSDGEIWGERRIDSGGGRTDSAGGRSGSDRGSDSGGGRSDSGGDRSDKDGELCVGGDVGVHTGRVSGVNNGGLEEEGGG